MLSKFRMRTPTYAITLLLLSTSTCHTTFGQICEQEDCPEPVSDYGRVYQHIWDADQSLNGIPAVFPGARLDPGRGYIVVSEPKDGTNKDKDLNIFSEVVIPVSKRATYDLCKKLFDNYTLDQSKRETKKTQEEKEEVAALIEAIKDTAPMKIARRFIEAETATAISSDTKWVEMIEKLWFEIYDHTEDAPHRCGFEHVFVGEKDSKKLGGYHFWHKYYMDDKIVPGYANEQDNMQFLGVKYSGLTSEGVLNPQSVTLSHEYNAYDYENGGSSNLLKNIGGFMVGCSPEGLMALGMVAFYDPRSRKSTEINNANYNMKLFKGGPGKQSINTFYSVFTGFTAIPVVEGFPVVKVLMDDQEDRNIRIIAALVNPEGVDDGKETVTLINASDRFCNLKNWKIVGNNGNSFKILQATLEAGDSRRFILPVNSARLSNKSAKITLKDGNNRIVHEVNYKEKQKRGVTIVF